ncbi:hypothetical protein RB195_008402 [Necator americanus]|uniref:Uncharacterized protein n=1 Tax=Necator americanus TaxID=51031 RepID=A0ABR1CPA3_NECAM
MSSGDIIIKEEEPDFYEENEESGVISAPVDEIDLDITKVDENLRIYGVKIWPHICSTVKVKRSTDERRQVYRKCTALVLKKDPNVFDRSISKCLAKRYVEYKLWAGSLTRYAVVIRNKFRPNNNSRTVPVITIDDDYEKGGDIRNMARSRFWWCFSSSSCWRKKYL